MARNVIVSEVPPNPEVIPEQIEQRADEFAATAAMSWGFAFDDPLELVNLDGERAIMFHLSDRSADPHELWQFFATHAGRFYWGQFIAKPDPANLADIHSILASWHWYPSASQRPG
jgi:hypothetical protein